jgi:hypothetical protein
LAKQPFLIHSLPYNIMPDLSGLDWVRFSSHSMTYRPMVVIPTCHHTGLEITIFFQNVSLKLNVACPAIFWHTTCGTHANGPVLLRHQIPDQISNEITPGRETDIHIQL